jgi:hypothetical protein
MPTNLWVRVTDGARTCTLRSHNPSEGIAGVCSGLQIGISKRFFLLCFAACCTVLRSRWYQIGIRTSGSYSLTVGPMVCRRALRHHSSGRGGQVEADGLFGVCMS